jgi:hypothetical protein
MLTVHNETVNAWSLLAVMGTVLVLTCARHDSNSYHLGQTAALAIHLPFAFMYHTMTCSPKHARFFREMDAAMVAFASAILTYCTCSVAFGPSNPASIWLSVLGLLVFWGMLRNAGKTDSCQIGKHEKTITTQTLAFCVFLYNIPILYTLLDSGTHSVAVLGLCLLELVCIMGAAALYVFGFPESCWPGRFDNLGNSHHLARILLLAQQVSLWFLLA